QLRVDAVHAARLVLRLMAVEALAVHQQALGAALAERELAMLEPLLARNVVRPGARAIEVRRPQELAARAAARLHCPRPQAHYNCAVRLAHRAPAAARVAKVCAARLKGFFARDEMARVLGRVAAGRALAPRLGPRLERLVAP